MKILANSQKNDRLKQLYDIADDMIVLLQDNSISGVELYNCSFYVPIPEIGIVEILIDGDWKHDHHRADYLIKENFNILKYESYALEDTGSDWGPEVHSYYIYLD